MENIIDMMRQYRESDAKTAPPSFPLSLAMIVRNEEAVIGQVLDCARQVCDEMIVIDTGSTDHTIEIAKEKGAKVHYFEWINDFSAARNYSFSLCSGRWILWLDADDFITPENIARIIELKQNLPNNKDAILCQYALSFAGDKCLFGLLRERFIRKESDLRWHNIIHETISFGIGRDIARSDICIQHRPKHNGHIGRNLEALKVQYDAGNHSNHILFHLGQDLITAGLLDSARTILEEYNFAEQSWMRYWVALRLGSIYKAQNDFESARNWYLVGVRLYPARAEAWCALGRLHYDRGEWAEAMSYYSAACHLREPLDMSFRNPDDYGWVPRDFLAVCAHNAGDHKTALQYGSDPIVLANDCERVRNNLTFYKAAIPVKDKPTVFSMTTIDPWHPDLKWEYTA